jgi:myo-inositol 2-dehydrogenase/D-chiro-inositol 1-dehydrogenase
MSMTGQKNDAGTRRHSRREFMKTSSLLVATGAVAGSVAGQLNIARAAHAYGSDTIKIGLIGCGGRGTGAAVEAMNTTGGEVKLIAMADAFADRIQASFRSIKGAHPNKVDVPKERQFVGFDGYKELLQTDVDLVILATPPGFRPLHFEAAVRAGKHVFMEKPVAVDAPGVRRVLAATEEAKKKSLAVAVGLQRRHERAYMETIAKLQEGAIGRILLTRAYWNGAGVWVRPREPNQTELEYQMRNWYYFNWLCGDHIVEQHIHNLDVINWLMNGYPVEANGMGGRQVRTGKEYGEIYDHHFVEFTYADGSKMYSQCRHIPNTWNNVSEHAHGTEGTADISGGKIYDSKGKLVWQTKGSRGGHQQEHHDLFAALRRGDVPNEGEYGALSSMTAILGRMATYSGQVIRWEDAIKSELKLADIDKFHSFEDEPPVLPNSDGWYAVAMPGQTKVL